MTFFSAAITQPLMHCVHLILRRLSTACRQNDPGGRGPIRASVSMQTAVCQTGVLGKRSGMLLALVIAAMFVGSSWLAALGLLATISLAVGSSSWWEKYFAQTTIL